MNAVQVFTPSKNIIEENRAWGNTSDVTYGLGITQSLATRYLVLHFVLLWTGGCLMAVSLLCLQKLRRSSSGRHDVLQSCQWKWTSVAIDKDSMKTTWRKSTLMSLSEKQHFTVCKTILSAEDLSYCTFNCSANDHGYLMLFNAETQSVLFWESFKCFKLWLI